MGRHVNYRGAKSLALSHAAFFQPPESPCSITEGKQNDAWGLHPNATPDLHVPSLFLRTFMPTTVSKLPFACVHRGKSVLSLESHVFQGQLDVKKLALLLGEFFLLKVALTTFF